MAEATAGAVVDAVVEEPLGCHPSFVQGYYDRDNAFYLQWDKIARGPQTLEAWLKDWVYDLASHGEYVEKPHDIRPALERAFASGKPAVVNVITDSKARAQTVRFSAYTT